MCDFVAVLVEELGSLMRLLRNTNTVQMFLSLALLPEFNVHDPTNIRFAAVIYDRTYGLTEKGNEKN